MQYNKPPLSHSDQAGLIISRGLIADKQRLINILKSVNYYRFSGYLYSLRQHNSDAFIPGATLDEVWARYCFDRELRLYVMDGIEKVEIAFRTAITYHFANCYGPFGHAYSAAMPQCNDHQKWLSRLADAQKNSKEAFVTHFLTKYGDMHAYLPIWMAAETMTFGDVLTMYRSLTINLQKSIALDYHIPHKVLTSWFVSLNAVRNICAHHARLWNRVLGYKPLLPRNRKYPDWHIPQRLPNDHVFVVLTILRYLVRLISPHCNWCDRFDLLVNKYPSLDRSSMGFPTNWTSSPFYK